MIWKLFVFPSSLWHAFIGVPGKGRHEKETDSVFPDLSNHASVVDIINHCRSPHIVNTNEMNNFSINWFVWNFWETTFGAWNVLTIHVNIRPFRETPKAKLEKLCCENRRLSTGKLDYLQSENKDASKGRDRRSGRSPSPKSFEARLSARAPKSS